MFSEKIETQSGTNTAAEEKTENWQHSGFANI